MELCCEERLRLYLIHVSSEGESSSAAAQEGGAVGTSSSSGLPPEQELPEGVDPSFLAALPDDMREEVIAEQLR